MVAAARAVAAASATAAARAGWGFASTLITTAGLILAGIGDYTKTVGVTTLNPAAVLAGAELSAVATGFGAIATTIDCGLAGTSGGHAFSDFGTGSRLLSSPNCVVGMISTGYDALTMGSGNGELFRGTARSVLVIGAILRAVSTVQNGGDWVGIVGSAGSTW
jgi:hypothetical protein